MMLDCNKNKVGGLVLGQDRIDSYLHIVSTKYI
jgi:hypothetical protein